jgi:hypothetical protein
MSKRQVEELNSLIRQRKNRQGLGSASERQPIPSGSATSTLRESQPESSGGGIASPRTEVLADRTYHPEYPVYSSDGLYVIVWQDIASVKFLDADSVETVDEYGDPNAP